IVLRRWAARPDLQIGPRTPGRAFPGRPASPAHDKRLVLGRKRCVPDPHGPVRAGPGQAPAVGAKSYSLDSPRVPPQGEDILPRGQIPYLDLIRQVGGSAAGSKTFAIGTERYTPNTTTMAF